MPLAPTPLSGCPLRRLEIHDGSTSTVYDAAQLESCLTATLEARRAMDGDANDMMLQSHLGLQRVLSIQLTELIASSNAILETVTVDRPSHRMCIQIHQKNQTVLFTFKETRDFNVITYALRKFGFQVKDGISKPPHATSLARCQSYPTPSPSDFAPRLSSITPLHIHGNSQTQSQFSFTSMLSSDVPLTHLQSTDSQYQPLQSPPQDLSQQSVYQMMPGNTYAPYKNPHQLYLSHYGNMYQPRVSSPLRNAVGVNNRDTSPAPSTPNTQLSFFSNVKVTESLQSHRFISEPGILSQRWQQQGTLDTNGYTSPYSQESPQASQETVASNGTDSQSPNESDVSYILQSTQDFRALMPRTRNLPFVKDSKSTISKPEPVKKQASTESGRSKSNSDILIEEILQSDSGMNRSSASQTNLQPTASQLTGTQTEILATCHSSCEIDESPSMFVTDNGLLEGLNKVTWKLLDQYTTDIGRGCDSAACAQFYLEQIDSVRREFWLGQLKKTNDM